MHMLHNSLEILSSWAFLLLSYRRFMKSNGPTGALFTRMQWGGEFLTLVKLRHLLIYSSKGGLLPSSNSSPQELHQRVHTTCHLPTMSSRASHRCHPTSSPASPHDHAEHQSSCLCRGENYEWYEQERGEAKVPSNLLTVFFCFQKCEYLLNHRFDLETKGRLLVEKWGKSFFRDSFGHADKMQPGGSPSIWLGARSRAVLDPSSPSANLLGWRPRDGSMDGWKPGNARIHQMKNMPWADDEIISACSSQVAAM